jgi:hypothetical protein
MSLSKIDRNPSAHFLSTSHFFPKRSQRRPELFSWKFAKRLLLRSSFRQQSNQNDRDNIICSTIDDLNIFGVDRSGTDQI